MPIVNVWIKDEDYSKYLVVRSSGKHAWGEFIHQALRIEAMNGGILAGVKPIKPPKVQESPGEGLVTGVDLETGEYEVAHKVIKTPKDAEIALSPTVLAHTEAVKRVMDRDASVKLCKIHGTPLDNRGKCLQKGCKYA